MKRIRPERVLRKKTVKKIEPEKKKSKKIEEEDKVPITEVYDPPQSLLSNHKFEREENESEKNLTQLSSGQPLFVVHKHEATNLHYDLRLEIDGTLTSWAVPKGFPKESEKRLAILVEDHPISYATFEGIIPQGQYGSGTVMAWDFGTISNFRKVDLKKSLKEGKIEVQFKGKKLNGVYALIRTNMSGNNKNWLLFRMKKGNENANPDPPEISENLSAISEKTMEEIAQNRR